MKDRGIHAAALQEAWAAVPSGRVNDETDGFLIIWHGETVRPCNRGRLGVVIILSPVARLAWEARGELVRKYREGRVMTVDLALEGSWAQPTPQPRAPSRTSGRPFTTKWRGVQRAVSRARIPMTLNPRKEGITRIPQTLADTTSRPTGHGSRSRMHWRNEQGADARNKTHLKVNMKDNQQTHFKGTSHCARALVFGERRRLSSLVPTAIGRILD